MRVTKELFNLMKEAGIRNFPKESCGLIYKRGKKGVPVECKNISSEPEHNFLISASEYAEVLCKGEIIGAWHTHCNTDAKPSDADKQGCENTEMTWFIGEVHKNEKDEIYFGENIEVLVPSGFVQPLVGRNYCYGTFDCYTLLRDYYKQEYDIDLGEWERDEDPWMNEEGYFERKASEIGFQKINGTPKKGDIFLIQMGTNGADHVAIYVGDDKILHHINSRLSNTDIYGGSYWQMHTLSHWRHKDVDENLS